MKDGFKYEVAFSFVERDLETARQIADRIRDRLSVFVYREKPEEFVAADGVDAHHRIYEVDALVVVVLYREEWGHTPWTRVEVEAIKNRARDQGYDFLMVIPLDGSAAPLWLPKTRIMFSLSQHGVDGVAGVIEAAVRSQGGDVRRESAVDYAVRLSRTLSFKAERREWYESERGVEAAAREFDKLLTEFQKLAGEIAERAPRFKITVEGGRHFKCYGIEMQVLWRRRSKQSLKKSHLRVRIFRERLRDSWGSEIIRDGLHNAEYTLDWDVGRRLVWREVGGEGRLFTSVQLADHSLKVFLDNAAGRPESDEDEQLN